MYLKVTDKQLLKMIKQLIDMPFLQIQKIDYSDYMIRWKKQARPNNQVLPQRISDASLRGALERLNQL